MCEMNFEKKLSVGLHFVLVDGISSLCLAELEFTLHDLFVVVGILRSSIGWERRWSGSVCNFLLGSLGKIYLRYHQFLLLLFQLVRDLPYCVVIHHELLTLAHSTVVLLVCGVTSALQ